MPPIDRRRRHLTIALVLAGTAAVATRALFARDADASQAPPPAGPAGEPLAVWSFNIRYGTARDGDNHWTKRRDQLFDLLRTEQPDLVGLQEALRVQIDEILAAVPGYASVGVGRDDGKAAGETSAILFRTARFSVAETGTFWFSDTPEIPGSTHWGNRITRICTWARFVDRDGATFLHYNVHLDHESQPSREKSTALLRQRIEARRAPGVPVIVTGDFNAGEQNAALRALIAPPGPARPATPAASAPFLDTFRVRHPEATEVGTFSGFTIGQTTGEKIDYVLVEPGTAVLDAAIVRASRDGRYPSDHFPVTARIRFPAPPMK
jgi:endonuclease/exonuclease/phosphatase family metal-dependent hydrolase